MPCAKPKRRALDISKMHNLRPETRNQDIDAVRAELEKRILRIRMMIFDVDGVLTDGRIIYTDAGSELKEFDAQDRTWNKAAPTRGDRGFPDLRQGLRGSRASRPSLGITRLYQGSKVKLEAYGQLLSETGLKEHETGFMGDDLIDIPVMRRAGFSVAVPNGASHIFPFAHYITRASGGRGAAREVCEMILQVQGLWESVTERYLADPPKQDK